LCVKVAKKSPVNRWTITVNRNAVELLDALRGDTPKSVYVEGLIQKENSRREREAFYRRVTAAYTPEVCAETLELNRAIPVVTE
jgi:hypothetical protein